MTVTSGSLQPAFSSDVANYTVDVATSVASVTVTAQSQNAGATVSINGQTATSQLVSIGAPGSSTPIPIVVAAVSGSQNTYIVTVNRTALGGNNNFQSLTVTPGPLVPAFAASATRYTLDVATSVTSVTVTARAQDAGATVSINSQTTTSRSVTLGAAGTSTLILIDVVAPNGNEKTYTVVVNRAAPIPPPTITTTTLLLSGAVGITYSDQVQATGGIGNLMWSISVGFLPPGLNIDQGTGVISGTPDTAGSFDFTVQATDTFPQSDTRNLSITISP